MPPEINAISTPSQPMALFAKASDKSPITSGSPSTSHKAPKSYLLHKVVIAHALRRTNLPRIRETDFLANDVSQP
jgi:hypothetical protein